MTRPPDNAPRPPPKHLPTLLLLFVGSGAAALIYQIVWFQQLQFVIGASGISLGVLLGTFMGGMFLGSLALPKYVSIAEHPLKVYAGIELGIGLFGVLLLFVIPTVGGAYASFVPTGWPSVFFRAVLSGVLLLPPTILMGATLPAIARYVEATPRGISWMGFFYAGNIAGAVLGSLAAGFYLLRLFDTQIATFVAVAINFVVAGLAMWVARISTYAAPRREGGGGGDGGEGRPGEESGVGGVAEKPAPIFAPRTRPIHLAIALSGLTALGAEVVWTRLMSLVLGATTYTFSIILAVFLAALGIGSGVGSYLARTTANPRAVFGVCQALLIVSIAWTAYIIGGALPFWPIDPSITSNPWFVFQIDLFRAVVAMFPAPLFWGASFPLAVAAAADGDRDSGRLMAGVYASNTVGAIVGSLAFGLVIIPWLGTHTAQRLLMGGAAASALILLWPFLRGLSEGEVGGATEAAGRTTRQGWIARTSWGVAGVLVAIGFIVTAVGPPPVLIAYGRYAPTYEPPNTLYVGEGISSSIAVTELENGDRNIHVGGKIVASTEPQDMRLQRMLGHMTALLKREEPRSVLIVGFGAGVTAGSFVTHPGIERIVIAEIEPLITEVSSRYFADYNHDVLSDPRVEVIHDDARHFLATTDETFDLITADPIHPWMKGAAALYSEEYFALAREHLNPDGVITQWVPLYESTVAAVKSELATFFAAFPEGLVWANTVEGTGYDILLSATGNGDPTIDLDVITDRFNRPDYTFVAQSLNEVGFVSANSLLTSYAGRARDLAPWLEDAEINRDRNLRLQYLAGLGLNRYDQATIFEAMLEYWRYPADVFVGSDARVSRLKRSMGVR